MFLNVPKPSRMNQQNWRNLNKKNRDVPTRENRMYEMGKWGNDSKCFRTKF